MESSSVGILLEVGNPGRTGVRRMAERMAYTAGALVILISGVGACPAAAQGQADAERAPRRNVPGPPADAASGPEEPTELAIRATCRCRHDEDDWRQRSPRVAVPPRPAIRAAGRRSVTGSRNVSPTSLMSYTKPGYG